MVKAGLPKLLEYVSNNLKFRETKFRTKIINTLLEMNILQKTSTTLLVNDEYKEFINLLHEIYTQFHATQINDLLAIIKYLDYDKPFVYSDIRKILRKHSDMRTNNVYRLFVELDEANMLDQTYQTASSMFKKYWFNEKGKNFAYRVRQYLPLITKLVHLL